MAKRKTKRNAGRSVKHHDFKIRKHPTVSFAGGISALQNRSGTTARNGQLCLFAIARDAHTIFASWKIDWRSVFQRAMPIDKQVYLQLTGADGVVETRVPVEPMSLTHYLSVSGLHNRYHIEMGYFGPDSWQCVATADNVEMPIQGSSRLADVDLATIPFHMTFQQLADLHATHNSTSLARAVSEGQKQVLSTDEPNETSGFQREVLRNLNLSLHELAGAHRRFENIDIEKLAQRARRVLGFAGTSPVRGLDANASS